MPMESKCSVWSRKVTLAPGEMKVVRQHSPVENPVLWSTDNSLSV